MVALSCLLFGMLAQADAASFAGTVVDSASGAPIAGVEIRLTRFAQNSQDLVPYGARSGEGGRFSITGMVPGTYVVVPRRAGYLPDLFAPESDAGQVKLQAGQQVTNAVVRMAAKAVISGRVLDERDRPVERGHIELESPENPMAVNSTLKWYVLQGARTIPLNERGEYRVGVPPGRYRVKAVSPGFTDSYFPAAVDLKASTPVDTAAGRETGNIDIRLRRRLELSISGQIVVDSSFNSDTTMFIVNTRSQAGETRYTQTQGRSFQVAGLAPGKYFVFAYDRELRFFSDAQEVVLESQSRTGLAIPVMAPFTVKGKVSAPAGNDLTRSSIHLEHVLRFMNKKSATPTSSGEFSLDRVQPGRYRVRGDSLPSELYVKTVKLGGTLVPGGILVLQESRPVEIEVAFGPGASISGVASDGKGPLAEGSVLVLLAPVDQPTVAVAQNALIAAGGKYRYGNLAPGKYHLLASPVAKLPDEAAMNELLPKSPVLEVKEGDRLVHNINMEARP